MNRSLYFLVDDICHLHGNSQKIDALVIAADTSVGSRFCNLPTTSAFSTLKNDLDHSLMMC